MLLLFNFRYFRAYAAGMLGLEAWPRPRGLSRSKFCGLGLEGAGLGLESAGLGPELFPGRVDPRVGSGRIGSGRVRNIDNNGGSGRVGSRPWGVGSGPSTLTRPDPPFFPSL